MSLGRNSLAKVAFVWSVRSVLPDTFSEASVTCGSLCALLSSTTEGLCRAAQSKAAARAARGSRRRFHLRALPHLSPRRCVAPNDKFTCRTHG